jgi:hypothetical protein
MSLLGDAFGVCSTKQIGKQDRRAAEVKVSWLCDHIRVQLLSRAAAGVPDEGTRVLLFVLAT